MPIISSILAATIANHAAAGPARTPLRDFFADPWMRRVLGFSFPSLAAWALFPDR
jgi:putative Ca2+/H+ antiporter (TMEM165/GDT1 family)